MRWLKKLYKLSKKSGVDEVHVWHILAALRGPDSDNIRVKELTIGRIRAIIGVDYGDSLISFKRALFDSEIQARNNLLKSESKHFRDHFERAMRALVILGYDVPDEEMSFGKVEGKADG